MARLRIPRAGRAAFLSRTLARILSQRTRIFALVTLVALVVLTGLALQYAAIV